MNRKEEEAKVFNKDKKPEGGQAAVKDEPKSNVVDELELERQTNGKLKELLKAAESERDSWMNKYYGSLADVQNLRKEIERDNQVVLKYAGEPFLKELIPFMQSLDQAFRFEPTSDPKSTAWIKGIHLSYKQLLAALSKQGVSMIEPKVGDKFDPSVMEAFETVEADKPDLVHSVWMKGFKLKDRLVQPAAVVVTVERRQPAPVKPEAPKKDEGEKIEVVETKEENK